MLFALSSDYGPWNFTIADSNWWKNLALEFKIWTVSNSSFLFASGMEYNGQRRLDVLVHVVMKLNLCLMHEAGSLMAGSLKVFLEGSGVINR
jgi:hypothetical protein